MAIGANTTTDGFSWSGSLAETDVRSLYTACHNLKFSGWLELKDVGREAKVAFLGGDPVEIAGGDTNDVALFDSGTFRAVQSIPNLEGELTDRLDLAGSLLLTKPSELWTWIGEHRLTCEIELERPGIRARLTFHNGHADKAEVNGVPELAALARVSSWTDGDFRVRLRPLFAPGVMPPIATPEEESQLGLEEDPDFGAKTFDVTRSMPAVTEDGIPWAGDGEPDTDQQPMPPVAAPPEPRAPVQTAPPTEEEINELDQISKSLKRRRRPALTWGAVALVAAVVGVVALYRFQLPPFSQPPTPIASVSAPKPAPAPDEKPPAAEEKIAAEKAPPVEKPPAEKAPVEKPPAEKPLAAKPEKSSKKDREFAKLVAKGRLALVSNKAKAALDSFRRAEKLKPDDPTLKVLVDQAQGKSGRAELWLEGKGSLVVDGKKFRAPKKLKLPAGPHLIGAGASATELVLERGEKKKLRVKK